MHLAFLEIGQSQSECFELRNGWRVGRGGSPHSLRSLLKAQSGHLFNPE